MYFSQEDMQQYITIDSGSTVYNGTDGTTYFYYTNSGRACTMDDFAKTDFS